MQPSNHDPICSPPTLLLGTAMWGWTVPRATCFDLLDRFYRQGFREVDGATNYPINKNPEDFRKAEGILLEWIKANGVQDLKATMKVGSINNLRTPDNNLSKSFLLMLLDEYRNEFGPNLDTFMIHWDNRQEEASIRESLEALAAARKAGLRAGLSGIKHPEAYARLNRDFEMDFRIQIKHNLLYSDYARYQPFHRNAGFIAYGINAGGIKLAPESYREDSSLKARGGNTLEEHPLAGPLRAILQEANQKMGRPAVSSFNHCGMAYAFYYPEIEGILLGVSRPGQLEDSLDLYNALKTCDYRDLYQKLKELSE
ncbi:MAG: aldo/keto reductase [Lewinellaceae bacterium]|nr:aldo/keto reductase [Phaeodactylibacter sp.]MCB9041306.1 aldo/keto reductase [Lewinellaceae bacterium]